MLVYLVASPESLRRTRCFWISFHWSWIQMSESSNVKTCPVVSVGEQQADDPSLFIILVAAVTSSTRIDPLPVKLNGYPVNEGDRSVNSFDSSTAASLIPWREEKKCCWCPTVFEEDTNGTGGWGWGGNVCRRLDDWINECLDDKGRLEWCWCERAVLRDNTIRKSIHDHRRKEGRHEEKGEGLQRPHAVTPGTTLPSFHL